jgi:hypothetical protein
MSFLDLTNATISCSGSVHVFSQSFEEGTSRDGNCAIYSAKWLRKRVGAVDFFEERKAAEGKFRLKTSDEIMMGTTPGGGYPPVPKPKLAREVSPKVTIDGTLLGNVMYRYNEAGPTPAYRAKATQYRAPWGATYEDNSDGIKVETKAVAAVEWGFHTDEKRNQKLKQDSTISQEPFVEWLSGDGTKLNNFLYKNIFEASQKKGQVYFYLSWDGHATACSWESEGFRWFDPARGEFRMTKEQVKNWFSDPRVVGYLNNLANDFPMKLFGFTKI